MEGLCLVAKVDLMIIYALVMFFGVKNAEALVVTQMDVTIGDLMGTSVWLVEQA